MGSDGTSGRGAGREGNVILTFEDDRDRRRKNEQTPQTDMHDAPRTKRKRGASPEVGHALRAAYEQAVREEIPPEMLDLLGKLG
ncbi:MAG: hypothetical protein JOZ90_01660 [Alphaproteobacteria bacterium]|nr:hypothetical protein [Alphaproteobacteria bacterium]